VLANLLSLYSSSLSSMSGPLIVDGLPADLTLISQTTHQAGWAWLSSTKDLDLDLSLSTSPREPRPPTSRSTRPDLSTNQSRTAQTSLAS
jgi:hypothetical protein